MFGQTPTELARVRARLVDGIGRLRRRLSRTRPGRREQARPLAEARTVEADYYSALRVLPSATAIEIERAYRQLAGAQVNAAWRPARAARELARINAAYGVLGNPERRTEYDRRQADRAAGGVNGFDEAELDALARTYRDGAERTLPRVEVGRASGGSSLDGVIILAVVLLALIGGSLVANRNPVDLSIITNLSESFGLSPRRRPPASAIGASESGSAPRPSPAAAVASPVAVTSSSQRFAGSFAAVSDPEPVARSDVTVTLKLVREGQPVPNANVYSTVRYRTREERQPPGNATVRTDDTGTATITFNIENATRNFRVEVDVTALVDGQQVAFQTSFTPR